jgi:hypothetical protein
MRVQRPTPHLLPARQLASELSGILKGTESDGMLLTPRDSIILERREGANPGWTGVRVSDLGESRSTIHGPTGGEVWQTRLSLSRSTSAAAAVIDVTVTVTAVGGEGTEV